jgi:aryl-alcohol dehydrogenase-like predicted oxidoreductase
MESATGSSDKNILLIPLQDIARRVLEKQCIPPSRDAVRRFLLGPNARIRYSTYVEQVALSKTGLKVSRLCFGAMTFGGQTDEQTAVHMVERCLEAGINFFDTANVYTGGTSEIMLGRALKGRRHRVVLATKVSNKFGDAPDQQGLSRPAIRRAIDESLKRLDTDYLDLYYMHLPDRSTRIEESLAAMDELVKEGKVRHVAQSNYAAWQVAQMQCIAGKNGYHPVLVSQPIYNLLARGIEEEFLPMSKEFGIANVVFNPLAGGLLTGKQNASEPIRGSRFDKNKMYLDRYWNEDNFSAVEGVRGISQKSGRSMVSLALCWLLHHTAIECVILGASKLEQLDENLRAAAEGPLNKETVAALDTVWECLRGVTPKYHR